MRAALALISFLIATPALAADFQLTSKVSEVVAYTSAGLITRSIEADLPAGAHRLIFDVPEQIEETGQFRFEAPDGSGLRLISSAIERAGHVAERPAKSAELLAAIDAHEAAKAAKRAFELEQAEAVATQRSAQLRLDYLRSIPSGKVALFGAEETGVSADQFGARIVEMGKQVAAAEADLAQAVATIDAAKARLAELALDVKYASEKVAALTPNPMPTVRLVLNVEASAPFAGALELNYLARDVNWRPSYELNLSQDARKGDLTIERHAMISQATGEDWEGVKLTLSTAAVGGRMTTHLPREWVQTLAKPQVRNRSKDVSGMIQRLEAPADAQILVEERSNGFVTPQIKGQTIEFVLKHPQDLRSDYEGGRTQIDIDSIDMTVDLFAKANADGDQNGFLFAEVTNSTGGNFLNGTAFVYRDEAFMGVLNFPAIPNGDSADVSFGPLDGLLVERRTISREDGDRGIISTSNERSVRFETKVTSLLDYPIELQLFDRIPVSESEDLKISEVLRPKPSERDVEGKRGVLRWDFEMTPGAVKTLAIGFDTVWPEGQTIQHK